MFKMEHALFTRYREGERAFYVSFQNWKGDEEDVSKHYDT
jgi:hypothetical protein